MYIAITIQTDKDLKDLMDTTDTETIDMEKYDTDFNMEVDALNDIFSQKTEDSRRLFDDGGYKV